MAKIVDSLQNFSRSMADFSWALSVFGISQASKTARDLATAGNSDDATKAFSNAATALKDQLDGFDHTLYQAGESAIAAGFGAAAAPSSAAAPAAAGHAAPQPAAKPENTPHPTPPAPTDHTPPTGAGSASSGPALQPSSPVPLRPTAPLPSDAPGPRSTAASSVPAEDFFPAAARAAFAEEVFSVYILGNATVDPKGTLINLNVNMFDFEGQWVGVQNGTQADYDPPEKIVPLALSVPEAPSLPIDTPPVPHITRNSYTQGAWTFNDGSAIFARGPSWTHMIPLKDNGFMFMISTSHIITNGTGRFEGIRGIKQGTGSAYIEPGLVQEGKFPAPGVQFTSRSIDTFRFLRNGFLDIPALAGSDAKVRD